MLHKKWLVIIAAALNLVPVSNVQANQQLESLSSQVQSLQSEFEKAVQDETSIEAEKENLGKRSNPVPLTQTLTIQSEIYGPSKKFPVKYELTINGSIRGEDAQSILNVINLSNDGIPIGYEAIVMDVTLNYLEGDEDEAWEMYLPYQVFSQSGKEIKQNTFIWLDNQIDFNDQTLFPNNSHSGYIVVVVP